MPDRPDTFVTQLNNLMAAFADEAECEAWECHTLPDGQHHECCLTGEAAAQS